MGRKRSKQPKEKKEQQKTKYIHKYHIITIPVDQNRIANDNLIQEFKKNQKRQGRWTAQQQEIFVKMINLYGKDAKQEIVKCLGGTRTLSQVTSHYQKYMGKQQKKAEQQIGPRLVNSNPQRVHRSFTQKNSRPLESQSPSKLPQEPQKNAKSKLNDPFSKQRRGCFSKVNLRKKKNKADKCTSQYTDNQIKKQQIKLNGFKKVQRARKNNNIEQEIQQQMQIQQPQGSMMKDIKVQDPSIFSNFLYDRLDHNKPTPQFLFGIQLQPYIPPFPKFQPNNQSKKQSQPNPKIQNSSIIVSSVANQSITIQQTPTNEQPQVPEQSLDNKSLSEIKQRSEQNSHDMIDQSDQKVFQKKEQFKNQKRRQDNPIKQAKQDQYSVQDNSIIVRTTYLSNPPNIPGNQSPPPMKIYKWQYQQNEKN